MRLTVSFQGGNSLVAFILFDAYSTTLTLTFLFQRLDLVHHRLLKLFQALHIAMIDLSMSSRYGSFLSGDLSQLNEVSLGTAFQIRCLGGVDDSRRKWILSRRISCSWFVLFFVTTALTLFLIGPFSHQLIKNVRICMEESQYLAPFLSLRNTLLCTLTL